MNNNIKYIVVALSILSIVACKTNLKEKAIDTGSANFTRYVAVGNSLTSGFSDGALSYYGQTNSFPLMLSNQFNLAITGVFNIPYLPTAGGGNNGSGVPRYILGYTTACNATTPSLSPIYDPAGATSFDNVSANGPFNLIGVPGARAVDCNFTLYSHATLGNPFLSRFCQTPGVSTMVTEAMRANPTFFTLWLGNNDVLLYATGGAVPPSGATDPRQISDTFLVRNALQIAVDSLTKFGAKGAIANVPNVSSVPFFTTIPWNSVVLRQGQADTLNALYAQNGFSSITWNAGANGLMIVDTTVPVTHMRHASSNDLILLTVPGDSLKCAQWGVNPAKPLSDTYVLDATEVAEIQTFTDNYNLSIANIASSKGLALVDMNSYMKTLVSGIKFSGINMNATFITGGAFSLDGVHPNPRGYALVANEFIRSINTKFGSTIPFVDVTKYNGIVFP